MRKAEAMAQGFSVFRATHFEGACKSHQSPEFWGLEDDTFLYGLTMRRLMIRPELFLSLTIFHQFIKLQSFS